MRRRVPGRPVAATSVRSWANEVSLYRHTRAPFSCGSSNGTLLRTVASQRQRSIGTLRRRAGQPSLGARRCGDCAATGLVLQPRRPVALGAVMPVYDSQDDALAAVVQRAIGAPPARADACWPGLGS